MPCAEPPNRPRTGCWSSVWLSPPRPGVSAHQLGRARRTRAVLGKDNAARIRVLLEYPCPSPSCLCRLTHRLYGFLQNPKQKPLAPVGGERSPRGTTPFRHDLTVRGLDLSAHVRPTARSITGATRRRLPHRCGSGRSSEAFFTGDHGPRSQLPAALWTGLAGYSPHRRRCQLHWHQQYTVALSCLSSRFLLRATTRVA
jgi:hypothetical protein